MYDQQPAVAVQGELPLRDDDHPQSTRQVLIVRPVLQVFRLSDEHVGQDVAALDLEQALEIVHLVPPDAQPLHQIQDQPVVVPPHLVAGVLLRLEVAGDAQLIRAVEHDAGPVVGDALGDDNVGVQALLSLAVKVDERAHGRQKSLGDGEPQPQPPGEAAAAGVRLIEDVVHLRELGVRHPDAGVADVDDQIDAVVLPPEPDPNVDAALLCELDGVLHQDLEHMGDLLRVPHQDRRHLRVNIEHQLQVLPVGLQGGGGDHIVEHRGDHVVLLGGGQGPLHDLRIVEHVVDLAGQALSRQLDGGHIRPDVGGEVPS